MLLAGQVDGVPATGLPLDDRGLAYGDGLFETVRVVSGRAVLLPQHLERLQAGAARLRLPCDRRQLADETAAFMATLPAGDIRLKIILTRGSSGRGYRAEPDASARRILLAFAATPAPAARAEEGIVLHACATRLGINPALAGLKHLNRLEQVLARSEWDDPGIAEGLVCDAEGRVVEGTMSNLFLVRDGVLHTPQLTRCGVAGVLRAWLIAHARAGGHVVRECDLHMDDVLAADELFVCNSNIGIWPVRRLGDRVWQPGPVTRALQRAVAALWVA